MKSLTKIFLLALLTVLVAGFLIKKNYDSAIETPNNDSTEKVALEIDTGESVDSIVNKLVEEGILKEKWVYYFKLYLKLNDLSSKIQAGNYQIPLNLSIKEIAETIQQAKDLDIWVTIPEGLRKDEIANILSTELVKGGNANFSKEEFLALTTDTTYISTLGIPYVTSNLEGFLFPDKYAFSKDALTKDVLKKLVDTFISKVGINDTYQDIIIASMVEREAYNSEDRPLIADIIKRRYAEGWLLQIDATLLYPKKDWKYVISNSDKEENNPYNTYKVQGLPPTPICNPGLSSINATRNPKPNNYYYYIHDTEGNVYFAETLSEHNRNIQTYLR
ncbi:hypothetical protein A3K02_01905 [candidate division WS6 bacterium RIFOXYD1_FULL_33_8]|uniref:Endolytic murein transglycosylase n=2 Tax=Candidatus Dojkabacteria TaxID=74243 RepID=A0A0G0CVX6_9BACT|nr:MAG: hypothetical protein UR32_C0005G0021 [candidate division WS6 bacterium GW2011_GWE2_33_157]KKP43657.1 MAG: hypothetical protein UR34_C0012G0009 [candidate division WS6 bacterium GW2011_GWC1_33_20]KKP45382.1 MAG: hypothetical protein UR36_C0008G0023 [candidate division WS6 bacterium GW2011_GWF1_33_233]KKP54690.1 MAG: hypothetical protein UR45_C0010G0009 [candidate division WS6 bacterium GW2011_WS6_33_547]KKP55160.1 MAG: hypothetical protein UR47_C0004G0009 [candidate division WS6 bacteriu